MWEMSQNWKKKEMKKIYWIKKCERYICNVRKLSSIREGCKKLWKNIFKLHLSSSRLGINTTFYGKKMQFSFVLNSNLCAYYCNKSDVDEDSSGQTVV